MRVSGVGEELIEALAVGNYNALATDDGIEVKAVAHGELWIAVENGIKLGIAIFPQVATVRNLVKVAQVFRIV